MDGPSRDRAGITRGARKPDSWACSRAIHSEKCPERTFGEGHVTFHAPNGMLAAVTVRLPNAS